MAKILKCEETSEWIEEEVVKPVEEWVEKTERSVNICLGRWTGSAKR